uniref:Uncharacterized protein n=1 Tax=Physcomitrium patens TaxID=3218 RepID=A0A2K1IEU1_PHYPA|nr:hypothetical protein PHYPA_029942 [Physcomitrium patens]
MMILDPAICQVVQFGFCNVVLRVCYLVYSTRFTSVWFPWDDDRILSQVVAGKMPITNRLRPYIWRSMVRSSLYC